LLAECETDLAEAVRRAWLAAFGRPATAAEARRAEAFLRARSAQRGNEQALAELCLALFNANEFVYVD
jgi:hypothetical protein